LIDTFNFLFRAYYALPKTLTDSDGNPTNAVYGVTSMLLTVFDALKPDYVIAALESKSPIERSDHFEDYKANRKPMDEDLKVQIPSVFEVLDAFGITSISVDGFEADDVIGTAVESFADNPNLDIIIVSNDRDLWQLLRDNVMIMIPNNKNGLADWVGVNEVKAKYGFSPKQMIEYKSLRGDPSDNIPGVKGIGEKTALSLIDTYGSLNGIYENIESVTPESVKQKLIVDKDNAYMSHKLATIVTNVPIGVSLSECGYTEFSKGAVVEVMRKYNFKSLIRRLGFDPNTGKEKIVVSENQLGLF
ncbi:DNA polymerase I, partial [Candidatus Saccharibacteria bacterium]|nr:DNA polymerase I [Candidatus Saccharibacteria bacterium]